MIDWRRKLTSRKLWLAVAGFVSGLILAFGGSESTATTVAGVILQGAAVIGYLLAEGLTDAAHAGDGSAATEDGAQPGRKTGFAASDKEAPADE